MGQISGDNAPFPQNTNAILNSDDTHYYRASRALWTWLGVASINSKPP